MDNRVEIIVGAQDNSRLDLDSLKHRLEEIGKKVETARVDVTGDKEAEVALERMALRLASIGRKVASPRIGLEGAARAEVEIAGLDLSMDRLKDKFAGSGSGGLTFGINRAVQSLGQFAGMGTSLINPITLALGALVAIMTGPLIAALLPITAGFVTFAAIAVPEITKVWTAVSKGGAALKKLSPDERALAGPIESLKDQFGKLAHAVQPQILHAFGTGLDVIKQLMPALTPLAVAAGKAIGGFLKHIDSWLKSDSGKKFLKWMEVDGPKAIATFGRVMWDVAQAVGRTFAFLRNAGDTWYRNVHSVILNVEHGWRIQLSVVHSVGAGIAAAWRAAVGVVRAVWAGIEGYLVHPVEAAYHVILGIVHAIGSALASIPSMVNNALGGIPRQALGFLGLASGGIVGAATGGVHSGLRMVGERGRELVQLPAGSRVYNNSQTEQMMAGSGGGGHVTLEITDDGSDTAALLRKIIREHIRVRYAGNVTAALGA